MTEASEIVRRPRLTKFDGWALGAIAIAALVLAPIVAVLWIALGAGTEHWAHLWAATLPRYAMNSAVMMAGVGFGAAVIGTGAAWLVTQYRFPLRNMLQYALLLPMAIPSYIAAYAFVDLFEYAGPAQTGLRAAFGWTSARDYWFPEIRSRGAGILVMSLALYPYVYLFAREAFRSQGVRAFDVARSLGTSPWGCFLRVSLPLARPAIVAGTAIVMMEVLNLSLIHISEPTRPY